MLGGIAVSQSVLRDYGVRQPFLNRSVAALLPFWELLLAIGLLVPVLNGPAKVSCSVLFALYAVMQAGTLLRGKSVVVDFWLFAFECG
ncbi:MauE/DoxX family redox-associated membrane protein [Corynebacterium uterequi]|uniref:Methylamine utilization protein MauE n=1 Tax=Corynebacterium uterequi TaxID=1072256 RepID=A0A0G3HIJ4_9CORY|nr:Methylamine utilization protein MauE [Corynebacterium uterequi]